MADVVLEVIEVKKMMKQGFNVIATTACLGFVMAALSIGPGCKKTAQPNDAPTPPTKAPAKPTDANRVLVTDKPTAKLVSDVNTTPVKAAPAATESPAAPAKDMVPLEIQLPKAIYVGTPQNLSEIPNLRPVSKTPRPPFLAPKGVQLLSLKKPVTSSETSPIIGEISYITDGDKEGIDGSEVQLGPGKQDVTIDLGKQCEIYAIVVWHYHKQACVVFDVAAQIAKDKDFVTDVKTVFNNDIDNSLGLGIGKDQQYVETNEGELIDCLSQGSPKGQYVKLFSKGSNFSELNYYIEVEVYGKPLE
jgi:hypothetical protein